MQIGQHVVCIAEPWLMNAKFMVQQYRAGMTFPTKGKVYTVRDIFDVPEVANPAHVTNIRLDEILNPPRRYIIKGVGSIGTFERGFPAIYFKI